MSTPTSDTPAELLESLLAKLPSALPTTMTAAGPAPTAGNDLYEAYLFGLLSCSPRVGKALASRWLAQMAHKLGNEPRLPQVTQV